MEGEVRANVRGGYVVGLGDRLPRAPPWAARADGSNGGRSSMSRDHGKGCEAQEESMSTTEPPGGLRPLDDGADSVVRGRASRALDGGGASSAEAAEEADGVTVVTYSHARPRFPHRAQVGWV